VARKVTARLRSKRSERRSTGRLRPLVVGAALVVLSGGCGGDALHGVPARPEFSGIHGQVRVAGEGKELSLEVRRTGEDDLIAFRGKSEESGEFRIPLDAGRYLVRCGNGSAGYYSSRGPTLRELADTLVVSDAGSLVRADFEFGRLDLEFHLPPALSRKQLQIQVYQEFAEGDWDLALGASAGSNLDDFTAALWPIPPGECRVRIRVGYDQEEFWLPGVRSVEDAQRFEVRMSGAEPQEVFFDLQSARIRGTMQRTWSRYGFHDCEVRAFSTDSLELAWDRVEAGGSAEFEMVIHTTDGVRLLLEVGSHGRWLGGPTFREATVFPLQPGDTTRVPLIEDGGLDVRLDVPLEWLRVLLRMVVVREDGSRETLDWWALGVRDRFFFPNLDPGRYRLLVEPRSPGYERWLPLWYPDVETEEEALPIEVTADGTYVPVVLHPVAGGAIAGVVAFSYPEDGDGQVFLSRADAPGCWPWIFSVDSESREFRFIGLPDGRYKLGFSREWDGDCLDPLEGGGVWYARAASRDSATVITIRDHETIEGIELYLL
jgi:hypothetical protein